jgi:hypothetical protein
MTERPRISLLHATFKRLGGPFEVRDAWLGRAVDPGSIEYIVSMDADDSTTVLLTEGITRFINPPMGGAVTAVRNWNAAAAASQGDLLVVIADDLFPPYAWDRTLLEMVGRLNPHRTPFAVNVSDAAAPHDVRVLLRHPIISRAFYNKFGLFSPSYRGVYCDGDFTARAFWRSVILDGRALRLEHRRPTPNEEFASAESQLRISRREEYDYGRAQYIAAWSLRKRKAKCFLVPTSSPDNLSHWRLVVAQHGLRAVSNVDFAFRGLRYVLSLVYRQIRTVPTLLLSPPEANR